MEFPHVSEILDLIDWGYKPIDPKVLNILAKYGTGLHKTLSKTTTGLKTRIAKKYRARADSLKEWMKENQFKTAISEFPIRYEITPSMGFCGTLDAIIQAPDLKTGEFELWDYKTGSFNKRHELQLAGYKLGYEFVTGNKIQRLRLVSPKKDGVMDLIVPDYSEYFLNLVKLYYTIKK